MSAVQDTWCHIVKLEHPILGSPRRVRGLFSGTSFPLDEDSRVCGRNLLHLFENRFEGGTIANDPLERTLGLVRPRLVAVAQSPKDPSSRPTRLQ
jgi:hypothetical protein